jgi:hypothetical protein
LPELKTEPSGSEVAVCVAAPVFVQQRVVPGVMVTSFGVNE